MKELPGVEDVSISQHSKVVLWINGSITGPLAVRKGIEKAGYNILNLKVRD